jgi:hypothetical protein
MVAICSRWQDRLWEKLEWPFFEDPSTSGAYSSCFSLLSQLCYDLARMQQEETVAELAVTFWPALFLQRRGWVFDQIRREGVTSVCMSTKVMDTL